MALENKLFILYKKNIPILLFEQDKDEYIVAIKKIFNLPHLPPHLFTNGIASEENEYGLCQKLEEFFNNRMIPYSRRDFRTMLSELELKSNEELARKSYYLSLSDQYWICNMSDMGRIWWEDINFFTNDYDDAIGLRLMSASKALNKHSNSLSPDNTTNGELPKRWVRKNGKNFLEKAGTGTEQQEALNEVLASEICRRLKINYVPYELEIRDEQYFCICPDMVDENTELVPMESVYQGLPLNDGKYDFEKLVERCDFLKIPDAEINILKIILLDFIIANEDRHSNNLGFLRHAETLQWLGVAPVYDSGKSMFLNKVDFEINEMASPWIDSKPFEEKQLAQFNSLPMEKLYGLVDFSALAGIQDWYKDFLKPLRRLSQGKKEALARKLGERIAEAQNLLEEKYRKSPLATSKSKEKASEKPEILLLKQLKENPRRTKEEFAEILSLSRATITRSLQKLVAEGKIRRLGSNKTGFWEVLE